MRREDFTVEGFPDGYTIRDVDLTPSGEPVCILAHQTDYTAQVLMWCADTTIPVPDDAVLRVDATSFTSPPLVRCLGEQRVLLVGSGELCSEIDGQPRCKTNARVLNHRGHVEQSFHVGHADEVTANENWIVTHYDDQAMTSHYHPVDRQGVAVFDTDGNFLWGFQSQFTGKPRLDVFFHAAAWKAPDEIAVYRDIDRGFRTEEGFILLDVRERALKLWQLPKEVHYATALNILGDRVMFQRAIEDAEQGDIVEWYVGTGNSRVVGHYPDRGTLRGLPGGRFIAPKPDGYTLLSFD